MKKCPTCNRTYHEETFAFCLEDGSLLSASYDPEATLVMEGTAQDALKPTIPTVESNQTRVRYFLGPRIKKDDESSFHELVSKKDRE